MTNTHVAAQCSFAKLNAIEGGEVVATTGCQWRMMRRDFPPFTTVQSYFHEWRATGLWGRINHHLVMEARELEGGEASPSAGVIDSQSAKTTESGGISGYDAGKKTDVATGASRQAVHVRAFGNDLIVGVDGAIGSRLQIGQTANTGRCSSMKEIIACTGGRAPPPPAGSKKDAEAFRNTSFA